MSFSIGDHREVLACYRFRHRWTRSGIGGRQSRLGLYTPKSLPHLLLFEHPAFQQGQGEIKLLSIVKIEIRLFGVTVLTIVIKRMEDT